MADNITYRFIQNVGDYFPSGYFTEDFVDKVQKCAGRTADEMKELNKPFTALRAQYEDYKNFIINAHPRVKDAIRRTHEWHTALLKVLGYDTDHAYQEPYVVSDNGEVIEMIPVRHILRSGDKISMLIMEMQHLISVDEQSPAGLFEQQYESEPDKNTRQQRYYAGQWADVIPAQYLNKEKYHFSPAIINKAVTQIFLMPEERRPHFILMLAGNTVFLFDKDKWARGSYLQFSIDDLYTQGQLKSSRNHYALFQLLVNKEALAADGQTVLMDSLIEESYKNAYEVTKDLKEGVILAVETLANEALYYMKHIAHRPFGKKHIEADGTIVYDETDDDFEAEVKDDCLTIVYRLLFILFAESRPELEILPTGDEVYKRGYSFEALRDLEQVRLISDETRNGYFFDDSIKHLFAVLSKGFHKDDEANNKSFRVRPIDSPMFNDNRLKQLHDVRIRNVKWQEIIRALSLSRSKKYCGRISYANLGVNQLGSVYESLLAYRGFYAEEDYIEVCKAGAPEDGTYLVPYSRMEAFDIREVICDDETGEPRRLPRGTFVYRLNGRDRQKSASYYTPEVLTRSTIKYTIKAIVDEVREGKRKPMDLLDLKILEPAVGAAAFLNEVINQLAEAYMTYVEKKPAPDRYRDELQKVKAYIATHNVYGVDLNPTAIELGKLSLWLNVIHKNMETPFFANRLTVGNAVIGAWLKVYTRNEVQATIQKGARKLLSNEWWTKAPHKVKFGRTRVNRSINEVYHFLLPDKAMLAALGLKDMKKEHATEAKVMTDRLKDWTAPIGEDQFRTLQRLSAKIDLLLREAMETQVNIEHLTNNRRDIWPHEIPQDNMLFRAYEQAEKYAEKERIFDTRYRHDNAYYKLKLVMDYWCALWFWEYQDAAALPTRDEYWREIENLLDVSNDKLDRNTQRAMAGANMVCEEIEFEYGSERMTEEQAQIVAKSKEEMLESTTSQMTLFADEEPERFKIAKRLADRYHFFHPMLEFIEVFWLRNGFDIICGNPPWLKLQFDDKAVLSERYPEVMIHKVSAPDARAMQTRFMADESMRRIYEDEQMEVQCSSVFMNAFTNYPLLIGQQTNLYKCVLTNTFDLASAENGYIGILCPESIYDDPNGQPLRCEMYKRLRYHFQYQNAFNLFAEVAHREKYGSNVFGANIGIIDFKSINNLFHPNTIDACFAHNGYGICSGIKTKEGIWNTAGHSKRIVHFGKDELLVLSKAFEDSSNWESTKLVGIHNEDIIDILKSLSLFSHHVADYERIISEGLHETNAVDKGWIIRNTCYPDWNSQEMIYSGPHLFVANPMYKTPRTICKEKGDYDTIDLSNITDDASARTNYTPSIRLGQYQNLIKGFLLTQNEEGNDVYDCWMDHYRVAARLMMGQAGERTLIPAIIPPHSSHIVTAISTTFRNKELLVEFAALTSSLVLDFFIKTIGCGAMHASRIESFPLGIADLYKLALFARTLRLNSVTNRYADLWSEVWNEDYKQEQWSIKDKRLAPWNTLTEEWNHDTPLRNYFERRQALVEIDVLAAMALGLTLDELIMMYEIQFPVLQQNENDTWYDRNGRIIFTCSKGLIGVGVDRPTWNRIREMHPGETFTHTLTSELYAGQTITYEAPFTCCDRVADYRTAWAHFEERFNK
jgi:hypothetical protein